jgi:uncharacterized protein (DUF58 family)
VRPRATHLGYKGLLFLAAVSVVFLATPYSNLFFLLMGFLCVLAVLGPWWSMRNLAGISGELVSVQPAAAGQEHMVTLRVRGPARGRMQITCRLGIGQQWHEVAVLPCLRGEQVVQGRLRGLPRGVHAITGLMLSTSYPLGVCEWLRKLPAAAEVVAHPAPVGLPKHLDARAAAAELAGLAALPSAGTAVIGLREYQSGDPLRAMHWKASARRGAWVVKETEAESQAALEVVLDRRAPERVLEHALSEATALVLRAAGGKEQLLLKSQGRHQGSGAGAEPVAATLRWLADTRALPATAPPPPPCRPGALRLPLSRVLRENGHG